MMQEEFESKLNKYLTLIASKDSSYEFEVRFGKLTSSQNGKKVFNTSISTEKFEQIIDTIKQKADYLERKESLFYEITKKQVRHRFTQDWKLLEVVKKGRKKEEIVIQDGKDFDLRLSISKENPVERVLHQIDKSRSTKKSRISYTYPYSIIDFTTVGRGKKPFRRIEIELIDTNITNELLPYIKAEIMMNITRINK